jgi:hypothetical protein
MLTLYTKSARKLSAAPARNAKLRLVGLAPRATLVPRLPRVGLALRANLAASFASSARGEGQGFALTSPQGGRGKATPLPHVSQIRTLNSVLCNLLCLRPTPTCFVIHLSTFAPASGRFAPLHCLSSVLDPALCTLLRLRILPFHFSTFAPLHGLRNSRPLSSVLRTPYSVLSPFHLCTGLRPICTFARFSHFMPPRISPYPPGLDRPSKIFRFMVYQKGPLRVGMIPPGGRRKAASLRLDLNPAQR